jgi:hypothetical protein
LPKIDWGLAAIIQRVPQRRKRYGHPALAWSPEITRPEEQRPTGGLRAETEFVVLETNVSFR